MKYIFDKFFFIEGKKGHEEIIPFIETELMDDNLYIKKIWSVVPLFHK